MAQRLGTPGILLQEDVNILHQARVPDAGQEHCLDEPGEPCGVGLEC